MTYVIGPDVALLSELHQAVHDRLARAVQGVVPVATIEVLL